MLLVDDLAAGGTKNLRHTPRGLVTLNYDEIHLVFYYQKPKRDILNYSPVQINNHFSFDIYLLKSVYDANADLK